MREQEEKQRVFELRVQHAQRIEALGTPAGGIAHDLNNTMVSVLALSKLPMKKLPADSAEHDKMKMIYEAGKRASDLVKQILAFSRKDAPSRSPLAIGDLVHHTLPMLRAAV